VDASLGWIDRYGDHDGDGLLDYRASVAEGLRNQGWRDSADGVLDEHGAPLEPPIALIEPQAYAARAKRDIARLFAHAGIPERASALAAEATAIEERLERFWLEDRRVYSMGLDGAGRASRTLASNQGHALWAAAIPPERAHAVRDALMGEALFSGWGIRTLGRHEAGFNPVGYHLGTVWPHDTALCAAGLRHDEDFVVLFEALLEAASHAEDYRLPELFAGFSRTEFETPVPYPVACQPQAWAAAAIPYLLTTGLGLHAAGLEGTLRIRRPSLPRWVNRVEVTGLCVGSARVDLLFERAGPRIALTDARVDGDLDVVLEVAA
jgi:glycogen debranching enzyme